jgi:uncharacterized protein YndB with AHSA1/START domain
VSQPKSVFRYVTYIRATQQQVWSALTERDFMQRYWAGCHFETDWEVGARWTLRFPDGRAADSGEVLEFDPPRRLALAWKNEWSEELSREGYTRCVMELEDLAGVVKLSITHSAEPEGAKLIEAVSGGWPKIISNLKSLLETGSVALSNEAFGRGKPKA